MKKLLLYFILSSAFSFSQSINITNVNGNGMSLKRSNEIYGMGDSQTANGGAGAQLTSLLGSNWNYVNYGIPGNTTTQMVARFSAITKGDANTVIILGGANDLVGLVAASTITANLQAMCTAAKNAGMKVILMTTTPFGSNVGWSSSGQTIQNTVNAAILSPTTIINVDYRLDIYTLLGGGTNSLTPTYDSGDGLHWSAAGQTAVGNYIYANAGFTLATTTPTLLISNSRSLDQDLTTKGTPAFKGLILNDSLKMGSNIVQCGPLTSTGALSGTSILASSNSTFTGIVYSNNSFQLGTSGVGGSMTDGGGALKFIGGSSDPDVRFCTPNWTNGRLAVSDASASVMVGDIGSMVADGSDLQVQKTMSLPILNLTSNSTSTVSQINFTPYSSGNSIINFKQSNGTVRGLIDMNIATGAFRISGQSGGYFLTFETNGSEKMRIATGGQVMVGNTSATATLNVTGNFSVSTTASIGTHLIGTSTAPTSTLGTGAGSGATATLTTCTDLSGHISITTAGTPAGSGAAIITLTFNTAFGTAPHINLTPTGSNSAALNGTTQIYPTSTTTQLIINSGTVGLTTGTVYTWDYTLTQ